MSDRNLHHLRPAEPARLDLRRHPEQTLPALSENDVARRVMVQQQVAAMIPHEPPNVTTDPDRLALLQSRLGDIADAFLYGHKDIDGEVLRLVASAQAWVEYRLKLAAK